MIIRLRKQGLSFGQIARQVDLTPQTCAYHVNFGLDVMRRKREREEEKRLLTG